MGELIDIRYHLHRANSQRMAAMILSTMSLSPHGEELVQLLTAPSPKATNQTAVLMLIDYCFPPPRLMKLMKPGPYVDSVIEEILYNRP